MTDTQIETARRNKDIYNLRQQGVDVKEIAKEFGITTVRVYQITNSYKPEPSTSYPETKDCFPDAFWWSRWLIKPLQKHTKTFTGRSFQSSLIVKTLECTSNGVKLATQ
jgi:hypothetical protein